MKISYENMKKVYDVMKGVINKKSAFRIMTGVYFNGENAIGGDQDTVMAKINGICENGSNVIPLEEIANMLKVFEKGNVIEIANGEAKTEEMKMKFTEMDKEQYPNMTDTSKMQPIIKWELNKEEIENIRNACECVDKYKNTDNMMLKYVNVYQKGNRFMIRSMDGYTLYIYEDKKNNNVEYEEAMLNQKLIKNIGKKVEKIELATYDKSVSVKWDNIELIATTIRNTYINTDRIFNEEYTSKIEMENEKITNALGKLDKIVVANAKKGNNKPITIKTNNNSLIIAYKSMENEIEIPVECKVEGEVKEMGLNCSMLLRNIELLNGDVKMYFHSQKQPIVIENGKTKILQTAVNC